MAQVYALVGTFEGCAGDLGLTNSDFSADFGKVQRAIYKLAAAAHSKTVVLNNAPAHFVAQMAALIQKEANLAMIGTKADWLKHDQEDIKMLAFYGDIAIGAFAVVENGKRKEKTSASANKISFPRKLSAITCPHHLSFWTNKIAKDQAQYDALLAEGLSMSAKVMVEEDLSAYPEVSVFSYVNGVEAMNKKHPSAAVALAKDGAALDEKIASACKTVGKVIIDSFAYSTGFASCSLRLKEKTEEEKKKEDDDGLPVKVILNDIELNPVLEVAQRKNALLEAASGSVSEWLAQQGELALELHEGMQAVTKVSFDNDECGYFLRAARDVKKGEVVMNDEGMTFTVTTRPYVMANWSEEDKIVFSRFAWPLESDSHVYVTWEKEPKRWRPINHSCDPCLVYGAGHSLNAVAERDIKEGDELTLDYATFCDFSMKPFDCFCGSAKCRGKGIMPTQAALEQYGDKSWHRRLPNTAAGKV